MAATFESATVDLTPGVSFAPAKPAGLAVGDILIAIARCTDGRTISPPVGWTEFENNSDGTNRTYIFTRTADAGDAAAVNFTFTASGAFNAGGVILIRISGAVETGIVSGFATGPNAPAVTCPDITTLVNNCLVIWGASQSLDSGPATIADGTECIDAEDASGVWVYAATDPVAVAGLVTGPVISKSGFGEARAFSIAISPSGVVPIPPIPGDSISGSELAILTARAGQMRAGTGRASYAPRDTVNAAGTGVGGFIRYRRVYPAAVTYTVVKT